jgi:hypothetical protein
MEAHLQLEFLHDLGQARVGHFAEPALANRA